MKSFSLITTLEVPALLADQLQVLRLFCIRNIAFARVVGGFADANNHSKA